MVEHAPGELEAFTREVIGVVTVVRHTAAIASWAVDPAAFAGQAAATSSWGTDRRHAGLLLDDALNGAVPRVWDTWVEDGRERRALNAEATEAAKAKLERIKRAFESWVWGDADRADRLARRYNDRFNDLVPRHFDGGHLRLPNASAVIRFYPHQKRVVWRIIAAGATYVAHGVGVGVGAGKTFALAAAVMEQKRLGLITKAMLVVPGHCLAQASREFLQLYPTARILVADESNFTARRRHRFLARAATAGWEGARNAATGLPLRGTGAAYRGLNVVILWITALARGYRSRHWFTLKQANALGRMIRKGETATTICFFDKREKVNRETGETEEVCLLKTYRVFNAEQLDEPPEWTKPVPAPEINPDERDARLEAFVAATGAVLDHEGPPPCYLPAHDRIRMPAFANFESADTYYGTLLHELVHWSGHASRLDRLTLPDTERGKRRQAYGYEELVAELGACMVAAQFGLSPDVLHDAAGYLKGWLELMRADKAAVIAAASAASKAR